MGENKDRQMLEKCISEDAIAVFAAAQCDEHPLDEDVIKSFVVFMRKLTKIVMIFIFLDFVKILLIHFGRS